MHRYRIAGLGVESEIALPGLIVETLADAQADVSIRFGDIPDGFADAGIRGQASWELLGDQIIIRIAGVARFRLTAGRAIEVALLAESRPADAAIYLLGTVFGALLHQRGHIVLHASAVRVGSKAVLFAGPSGAGKSTMAAALGAHGYPLISDDFSAITFDGEGVPFVQPDGRQFKLWVDSVEHLSLQEHRGDSVKNRLDKFYIEPHHSFSAALPIGAVYALNEPDEDFPTGIRTLPVADAALILRYNAYIRSIVDRMNQKALYFRAVAAICAKAGVFDLTRPRDFNEITGLVRRLETHWLETGLITPQDQEQSHR